MDAQQLADLRLTPEDLIFYPRSKEWGAGVFKSRGHNPVALSWSVRLPDFENRHHVMEAAEENPVPLAKFMLDIPESIEAQIAVWRTLPGAG